MPLWTGKDNSLASEDEHMVRVYNQLLISPGTSSMLNCPALLMHLTRCCTQAKFLKKFEGIAAAGLGGDSATGSKEQ